MAYDPNFMGPPTAGSQLSGTVGSMLSGGTSLSGGLGVLGNIASQGATGFASMLSGIAGGPGGLILSGLSSAIGMRAERKAAEEARKGNIDQARAQGDETRRTALYTTLLGDWKQRKDKFRQSQGLGNYRAFAQQSGTVRPGSQTERMLNFQSPNRVKDPGAAPDPQALHGQPEGNPRKGGYKPMYTITDDGRVESLRPNMKPSAIRPRG